MLERCGMEGGVWQRRTHVRTVIAEVAIVVQDFLGQGSTLDLGQQAGLLQTLVQG
jgi:hypothetical protein